MHKEGAVKSRNKPLQCSAGLFVLSYRKIFISCGPFSQSQCLERFMAVNVQKPRFEQIASGALV